jgi:hypothetical protein
MLNGCTFACAYLTHVLYAFVPFFLGSLANDGNYVGNDKVAQVCLFFSPCFSLCLVSICFVPPLSPLLSSSTMTDLWLI